MTEHEKASWFLTGVKWTSALVIAQWFSWDLAYRTLAILAGIELVTSSALVMKREGLQKWCSYAFGWAVFSKVVIAFVVYGSHLMSESLGNHFSKPIDLGPWVATAFSLQQFINLVKKSKGLDVDPPPIVEILMRLAERSLTRMSGTLVVEERSTNVSASGEVSTGQKVTSIRAADPIKDSGSLIIPASDVTKDPQK